MSLQSADGRCVYVDFTERQLKCLEYRTDRIFLIRCSEERLFALIDQASTYGELESIAIKYDFADICDFSNINVFGLKKLLKVVVRVLYRYPKLRGSLCFIGTHIRYRDAVNRIYRNDQSALKDLGLQHICSPQAAINLGYIVGDLVDQLLRNSDGYIATAVTAYGLLDAILFDHNDYNGYAYSKLLSDLKESEMTGFHPKGCDSPESVVYHEIGHMLDSFCSLSESYEFRALMSRLSQMDIYRGLSQYATTSPKEAIAEAFAEYMCNPYPRPLAKQIGAMLDQKYRIS